jgi:hypothetical protein
MCSNCVAPAPLADDKLERNLRLPAVPLFVPLLTEVLGLCFMNPTLTTTTKRRLCFAEGLGSAHSLCIIHVVTEEGSKEFQFASDPRAIQTKRKQV